MIDGERRSKKLCVAPNKRLIAPNKRLIASTCALVRRAKRFGRRVKPLDANASHRLTHLLALTGRRSASCGGGPEGVEPHLHSR